MFGGGIHCALLFVVRQVFARDDSSEKADRVQAVADIAARHALASGQLAELLAALPTADEKMKAVEECALNLDGKEAAKSHALTGKSASDAILGVFRYAEEKAKVRIRSRWRTTGRARVLHNSDRCCPSPTPLSPPARLVPPHSSSPAPEPFSDPSYPTPFFLTRPPATRRRSKSCWLRVCSGAP